jgi:hypothetical protein
MTAAVLALVRSLPGKLHGMWRVIVASGIILAGGDQAAFDGQYFRVVGRLLQSILIHFGF